MSYNGYSVKIGNVTIPNSAIVPGSYSLTSELRVKKKTTTSTGLTKIKYYNNAGPLHVIKFTIKPGTASEQAVIRAALASKTSKSVTYFNDDTGSYSSGTFWIKDVTWTHSYENNSEVFYDKVTVTLSEY